MRERVRRAVVVGVMGMVCAGAGAVWAGTLWDAPAGGDPVAPVVEAGAADRARLVAAETRAATQRAALRTTYEKTSPAFMVRAGTVLPAAADLPEAMRGRRVTVDVEKATAETAARALSKAAGVTIRGQSSGVLLLPDIPPVTLHVREVPLMEAVLELCSQAGWRVQSVGEKEIVVMRSDAGVGVGRWCVSGPVAVVLQGLSSEVHLSRAQYADAGAVELRLGLQVIAEPGLKVLAYPTTVLWEKLVDEKGHSLAGPDDTGPANGGGIRNYVQPLFGAQGTGTMVVPLAMLEDMGQRIVEMKATAAVVVGLKSEEVKVGADELSSGTEKEVAGMTVTVDALKKSGAEYISSVTYQQGTMKDEQWAQVKQALGGAPAVVMDEAGVPMRTLGQGTANGAGGNTVTVTQRYLALAGANQQHTASRETVDVPTEVQVIQAPVAFKDLVLP